MLSLDFFKKCPTLPKQESQFISNIGNQNQIREIVILYDILSYTIKMDFGLVAFPNPLFCLCTRMQNEGSVVKTSGGQLEKHESRELPCLLCM